MLNLDESLPRLDQVVVGLFLSEMLRYAAASP